MIILLSWIAHVSYAYAASRRRRFISKKSACAKARECERERERERERAHATAGPASQWIYCNLVLISHMRFNLIKWHRVCEASRARPLFTSVTHRVCTCCIQRCTGPYRRSYRLSFEHGKTWFILSDHFVVRVLTDLPASLSLSVKEYRLSREVRDFLLTAASRCAVTYTAITTCLQ